MKQKRLLLAILFPLTLLGVFMGALQTKANPTAIFTVNSTVDAVDVNPGDGVCETAMGQCTLRAAVQETNALPGEDTIQLGSNTYLLAIAGINEDAAATGDLDITDALTIEGNGSTLTIIDGNQLDRVLEVYFDASLTINGVMVTNGWLDTGILGSSGGGSGILNSSSLVIENSSIFSNTAHMLTGGGLYNNGGAITITNSTIISNAITGNTSREGAGISNISGSLYIESSHVNQNLGGFGYGGGIYSAQNTTISNTTVIKNDADYGGGLYLAGSALIVNSVISDNTSISGSEGAGLGGGIYFESAINALEIRNSTILSNTSQGGGGIYANGVLTITQSRILDNYAYGDGGGIYAISSNMTISDSAVDANNTYPVGSNFGGGIFILGSGASGNDIFTMSATTVSNNSAGTSGGIYLTGGSHLIQNSTVAYNKTTDNVGINTSSAIRVNFAELLLRNNTIAHNIASSNIDGAIVASSLAIITATNNIVANNVGGNCNSFGSPPELEGEIISNGNNLSSDSSCSFSQPSDLINTDPMLGPLQNHGGSTNTFIILPTSPAIDAGNDAQCLTIDQRGITRPQDGDGNGSAICDIGAVEVEFVESPMNDLYLPIIIRP